MKKWKSILLAVLAVGSLASCGTSGEPITREAAVAKLAAASQEMVKGDGLEVKAKAGADLNITIAEAVSKTSMMDLGIKFDGNAEAAVFFTEAGELFAAKAIASLRLEAENKGAEGETKTSDAVSAEAYLKDATLYAKESVKATETGVDPFEETTYYVSTIEALMTTISTEINDAITSMGGTEGINESLTMLEGLDEAVPGLTISTSGKKETIRWSMGDDELDAILKAVFVKQSEEELRGSIGEEAFNQLPSETLAGLAVAAEEMVTIFDPIIELKTLSLSVSILEGKVISDVKFKFDLAINELPFTLPSFDESVPPTTLLISASVKTNASLSIKRLTTQSDIVYPADLDTWASKVEQPAA